MYIDYLLKVSLDSIDVYILESWDLGLQNKTNILTYFLHCSISDFITQHSSVLCEELVKPSNSAIYSFIYHYLDIQSRSDAHQKIFGHGLNILIQLLTYHKTYDAVCEVKIYYISVLVPKLEHIE